MNPTKLIKGTTSLIVGAATTSVVRQIIKQQVQPQKATEQAAVLIGSYVLASMVSDVAKIWAGAKIEGAITALKKFKKDVEEETTEAE